MGSIKNNALIRLLKRDGWFVIRQTGSHMMMKHAEKSGQIVVPNHGNQEMGKGLKKKY